MDGIVRICELLLVLPDGREVSPAAVEDAVPELNQPFVSKCQHENSTVVNDSCAVHRFRGG